MRSHPGCEPIAVPTVNITRRNRARSLQPPTTTSPTSSPGRAVTPVPPHRNGTVNCMVMPVLRPALPFRPAVSILQNFEVTFGRCIRSSYSTALLASKSGVVRGGTMECAKRCAGLPTCAGFNIRVEPSKLGTTSNRSVAKRSAEESSSTMCFLRGTSDVVRGGDEPPHIDPRCPNGSLPAIVAMAVMTPGCVRYGTCSVPAGVSVLCTAAYQKVPQGVGTVGPPPQHSGVSAEEAVAALKENYNHPRPGCALEEGARCMIPDADHAGFDTPRACAILCNQRASCVGFNFIGPGGTSGTGVCELRGQERPLVYPWPPPPAPPSLASAREMKKNNCITSIGYVGKRQGEGEE